MFKFEGPALKLLFFIVPLLLLYGCSSPATKPPIPRSYVAPVMPKPEIIIPNAVQSELDRFKPRSWKYIVIHHSASDAGNASSIGKYHREVNGWENGLGYHFLIGNGNGASDGQIEVGNRWNSQIDGAHAGNGEYNKYGIGICLVGNFENRHPTDSQISSLVYLVNYLQKRCNISTENIVMHCNVRKTECPGNQFPYYDVLARLR
ncbi:MAG: peptidoglycan recognition protein family protein [Candidatus Scalindua sp.]|nr:peptidoglycan recognition protein family protein [Candidatus Scalindua sp.]